MINVYTNKTMFGKRTGNHTAELGEFNAEGKTATEAKSALLAKVAEYRPTNYVIGAVGATFIVTRSLHGTMQYSICGPGRTYAGSCLLSTTDAKTAVENARQHATDSFGGIVYEHSF